MAVQQRIQRKQSSASFHSSLSRVYVLILILFVFLAILALPLLLLALLFLAAVVDYLAGGGNAATQVDWNRQPERTPLPSRNR